LLPHPGCTTYDYVGGGRGGYYHGRLGRVPGYPAAIPDGYYDGYYGWRLLRPGYYYGGVYYYGGHRYYRPPPHRPDGDHDGGTTVRRPPATPATTHAFAVAEHGPHGERQPHRNDGPPRAPAAGPATATGDAPAAIRRAAGPQPAFATGDPARLPSSPGAPAGAVSRAGLAFRPTLRSRP
jgi:hypothetical protein